MKYYSVLMLLCCRWIKKIQCATAMLFLFACHASAIETYLPEEQSSVIVRSEYLVDTGKILTIDDVRESGTDLPWQALSEDYANFGYQPVPYWYRFTISNPGEKAVEQIIEVSYPLLDKLDFYEFAGQQHIRTINTGDRVAYSNRPIEHPHFLFPLQLDSGEKHTI